MLGRALLASAILAVVVAPAASALDGEVPQIVVHLDGALVNDSPSPIRIDPSRPVRIAVRLDNPTSDAIEVGLVRLRVRALGITYLGARADVATSVPAGGDRTIRVSADARGFGAVGLLPGRVEVLDSRGALIAATPMTTDVRGSIFSGFGLVAIAVIVVTLLGLSTLTTRLLQERMPDGIVERVRVYGAVGLGGGASIAFMGALGRVVSMRTTTTIVLMAAGAIVMGAIAVATSSEPLSLPRPRMRLLDREEVAEIDLTERVGRYITVERTSARVG